MGTTGCVSFMFDKKGQIVIEREAVEMDEDELMMLAVEAGADDFEAEEEGYTILTSPEAFGEVYAALEEAGIEMASGEVTMIPQTYATIQSDSDKKAWEKMIDLLENDDDVQEIYHNYEEE
jgi:transcriptional/translational regulatory protein YebC/TACO1